MARKDNAAFAVNILVRRDGDEWVAHCLEMDIVAVAATMEDVRRDLIDLIVAQVSYAMGHDNMHNLLRAAPAEVWQEFFECRKRIEDSVQIAQDKDGGRGRLFPALILTNTCFRGEGNLCHA